MPVIESTKRASCEMECAGADSGAKMFGTRDGSTRSAPQSACGTIQSSAIQNIHGGMMNSRDGTLTALPRKFDGINVGTSLSLRLVRVAFRPRVMPKISNNRHGVFALEAERKSLAVLFICQRMA